MGKARSLRRSVDVRREGSSAAGSTGGAAGIETLATSYGGAFDRLSTQVALGNQRTDELSHRLLDWQHAYSENRLEENADYQQQVSQLSIDLARAEMTIQLLESQKATIPAEVWLQLVPAAVGLLQGLATRVGGGGGVLTPPDPSPGLEGASTAPE